MPEPEKCTPPTPPEFPPMSREEIANRRLLRWCLRTLEIIACVLAGIHAATPDPPDEIAEEMGEETIPPSVAFVLRGVIECTLTDSLKPALTDLREAATLTPRGLYDAWAAVQRRERR